MPQTVNFLEVFEFTTKYSTDSVEWCPVEGCQKIFTCATYQLLDRETGGSIGDGSQRVGNIHLFQLGLKGSCPQLLQTVASAGILDCKWAHVPVGGKILLAVATADGHVHIYELKDTGGNHWKLGPTIKHRLSSKCGGRDTLALSLDWSTGRCTDQPSQVILAVSDSAGNVMLLDVQDGRISERMSMKSHDFEAWIVAFNYWEPNIFFSGGDDSKMNVYDCRTSSDIPVLTNRKSHEAGVTSMHSNPTREHTFITGSYDESVRLWDTRWMNRPVRTESMGGGVWRLKWAPPFSTEATSSVVVAACMYRGFVVVVGLTTGETFTLKGYNGCHTSIGYGADWCHLSAVEVKETVELNNFGQQGDTRLAALCSFYDRKMSLVAVNFSH